MCCPSAPDKRTSAWTWVLVLTCPKALVSGVKMTVAQSVDERLPSRWAVFTHLGDVGEGT